jgi:hypothetical protein
MSNISIRLEDTEKEALIAYARDNDLTLSYVVRKLIRDLLKSEERL